MKHLIAADVLRIVKKPVFRIMIAVAYVIAIVAVIHTKRNRWNGLSFVSDQYVAYDFAAELIFGIAIYVSVYADEFTSNSMQCLIGRGVSRLKLIIAKFIDCVIVTVISFGAYALFVFLLSMILRSGINGMEAKFLYGRMFVGVVKTIGFATISMIFLYCTKNTAIATLVDVVLIAMGDNLVNVLKDIPVIKFVHLENSVFSNAVSCANVSLMLGNGSAFFSILLELFKACAISLLLSYLLFRKKELDF